MPIAGDRPIRILHLSDFHFRAGTAWDAGPVLRGLASFLAQDVAEGLVPDLVVISGDLAFAGKAADYALARDWLDQALWPVLRMDPSQPLPRDRLLLVPGNHDADRGEIDLIARMVHQGLLAAADQDQIAMVLGDPGQHAALLKRHAAYLDFYGAWLKTPQALPWWQRTIAIRGQRLPVGRPGTKTQIDTLRTSQGIKLQGN